MALNKINVLGKARPMDSKKILERYDVKRIPVSLRIDEKLWEAFNKARGNASQGALIEDLLREFLAGLKDRKPAKDSDG